MTTTPLTAAQAEQARALCIIRAALSASGEGEGAK